MNSRQKHGFDALPGTEQAQVRAILAALNRGHLDLLPEIYLVEMELEPEKWGTPDQYEKRFLDEWRPKFAALSRFGKLPLALFSELVKEFENGAVVTSTVRIVKGRPVFSTEFRFHALERRLYSTETRIHTHYPAAFSFALLKLAEVSTPDRPALLCCKECGTFAAIEKTAGRRQANFCSSSHRNRFNQREFHKRAAKRK